MRQAIAGWAARPAREAAWIAVVVGLFLVPVVVALVRSRLNCHALTKGPGRGASGDATFAPCESRLLCTASP
jgi:hypothetical protein